MKAYDDLLPLKDTRELTSEVLKKESKILKELLKVIAPILKFIDRKIIIIDNIYTDYFSYSPPYIYDLDPLSTFKDKLAFKEIPFDIGTPKERHITEYYMENDKVMKGVLISIDIIKGETQYFGEDTPNDNILGKEYEFKALERTSSTAIVIYLLRDGKIMKFDRFQFDRYLFDYEHNHSLKNPQELSIEEFLQYNSPRRVINNILLSYHKAIMENENKFPILKKSLENILKMKL